MTIRCISNQSTPTSLSSCLRTQKEYIFERSGDETIVKDAPGNVLVRCAATEDGGIVLKDAEGKMISSYSKQDLANVSQRLSVAN